MCIRGSIRGIKRITALLAGVLIALPSHAMLITGSFEGIANGQTVSWSDGSITPFAIPITGTFAFETEIPSGSQPIVEPGSFSYSGSEGRLFQFATHIFGEDKGSAQVEGGWEDTITLLQEGSQQTLRADGGGPYWYWVMTLVDPDGGLFQNFNPETFDPRQVDLGASFIDFSGDIRSYGAIIKFTTLAFDGYPPQSVPEPTTLGLFGAGLLLFALRRRRAQRGSRIA